MRKFTLKLVSFLSILSLLIISCEDDTSDYTPNNGSNSLNLPNNPVDTTGNQGGGQAPLTSKGFVGDFDGARITFIASSSNFQPGVGSSGSSGATSTKSYQSSIFNLSTGDGATLSIGEIQYSGTSFPSNAMFQSLFTQGDQNYSVDSKNGVEVSIVLNNEIWSSSEGTADQTGSNFKFTQISDKGNSVEVKATFSCTLYDDSGNSKALTNGEFIGLFENF